MLLDFEKLRVREHAYPHVFQGFLVFLCTRIPQIETSVNSILFNQLTEDKFQSNFLILSKKKKNKVLIVQFLCFRIIFFD